VVEEELVKVLLFGVFGLPVGRGPLEDVVGLTEGRGPLEDIGPVSLADRLVGILVVSFLPLVESVCLIGTFRTFVSLFAVFVCIIGTVLVSALVILGLADT